MNVVVTPMDPAVLHRAMRVYVVYVNPKDYPGQTVVRVHYVTERRSYVSFPPFGVYDTLTQAHAALPRGLFDLGRSEGDDPVIREVWA